MRPSAAFTRWNRNAGHEPPRSEDGPTVIVSTLLVSTDGNLRRRCASRDFARSALEKECDPAAPVLTRLSTRGRLARCRFCELSYNSLDGTRLSDYPRSGVPPCNLDQQPFAAQPSGTSRPHRPRGYLGLHVSELPAHAALSARMARTLRGSRIADHRRSHSRVPVRRQQGAGSGGRRPPWDSMAHRDGQ